MNIIKEYLNGRDIYHAFISGAKKIIADRVYLNSINVFPVPDSDTGTNLALTMNQIILSAECNESVDVTLQSIYNASLRGARGNSGMIFTSFFSGLKQYVKGRNTLSMNEFSDALFCSVESAYGAVSIPVEGTMLTVLKDWAISIKSNLPRVFHFGELIEKSFIDAKKSLLLTKEKLDILKKANVVDSGGKGIVDFIEGIVEFFRTGKEIEHIEINIEAKKENAVSAKIQERYCTEVTIKGDDIQIKDIRSKIEQMGSSVVIAGDQNMYKIHLHSNDPEDVIEFAGSVGDISSHKIEDMKRQAEMNNRRDGIALVTDSIADVSKELIDKYKIHVIPLSLFIDGVEYFDKLSLKPERFYSMVDGSKEFPTSSLPPISKFDEVFSLLADRYDSIIGFFVSSKLSGTYQNAEKAAEKIKGTGYMIDVIDSKLNSGAEGLVLIKLAELIHLGKTHEDVVKFGKEIIKRTKIYVSVIDFKYMVRGGRVSPLKGLMAKMLNLKPIVSLDEEGRGAAFDKAFSVNAIQRKILKIVKDANDKDKIVSFSVVHAHSLDRAEEMAGKIEDMIGIKPLFISDVSSVVGISSGKGAVAISFITDR